MITISTQTFIRPTRLCLLLMSTIALSACGSRYQTLQVGDRTLLPSARVSRSLYRADRTLSPSEVQTELAVEGGLLGGRGSSEAFLFAEARVGNQTFTAPQTIDTDFDFKAADVSLHWRHSFFNRHIGYDFFGGLAWADFDFKASSPTLQARESISSPALRLGTGAFWRIFGGTSVEAEATVLGANHNFNSLAGHRFSLVQKLGSHVTVSGGYSSWKVETSNTTRSRIEAHLQGPAAGVQVKF